MPPPTVSIIQAGAARFLCPVRMGVECVFSFGCVFFYVSLSLFLFYFLLFFRFFLCVFFPSVTVFYLFYFIFIFLCVYYIFLLISLCV